MSIELSQQRRLVWNWSNFLQEDTRPRVIDTATGATLCELVGHTDYIRGGLELPDERLVTWSNDQTIRVWALADGRCEWVLEGHTAYVQWVLPIDRERVVSSSADGTLRVWSLSSGAQDVVMSVPEGMVSADGGLISGDRVLTNGDGHYALFDLNDGSLLDAEEFGGIWFDIDALGHDHFLVVDSETAMVLEACSGKVVTTTDMPGFRCGHFVLKDAAVLIWHHDYRKTKTLSFKLWWPLLDTETEGPSTVGYEPAALREQDGEVFITCNDYRVLRLYLDTLSLDETVQLPAAPAGDFRRYEPAAGVTQHSAGVGGLNVRPVTFEEADSLRWEGASWDFSGSHCWWSPDRIAFEDDNGNIDEWNLADDTHSTGSASDYYEQHPLMASLRTQQRLQRGDWPTLADWFASEWNVATTSVITALESLIDGETHARPLARATLDGRLLVWCPRSGSIHVVDMASSSAKVRLTNHSSKGNLVASHPLIAPDGQVYVREDQRFTPLVIDDRPVALSPDTRDSLVGARWCQGDRVVARHRSGVEVLDAATGESMAFLDGGHGLPNRGFVELANGTLVTWSRGVLRSWDAEDYTPLVEFYEPVDWDAAYEYVMPSQDSGVIFTVGQFSMDTRVCHWDGRDDLSVYTGHRNEVGSFVEGPGGRILSYEDDRRGDVLVWQLRQSAANLSQDKS